MPLFSPQNTLILVALADELPRSLVPDWRIVYTGVGKVNAAIQVSPECAAGGMLARVRDGDQVTVDAESGTLTVDVPEDELAAREPAAMPDSRFGTGRELFQGFRGRVTSAEEGASSLELTP